MTVEQCAELFKGTSANVACFIEPGSTLRIIESIFVIASCAALVAAAIIAWRQLVAISVQITDARQMAANQITTARDNERLAATLRMLIHIQTNAHWLENRKLFVELRDSKDGLRKHAQEHSKEAFAIRAMLNQYELISIGIGRGILDETMYRNYYRGTVVKDWMAAAQFIDAERKENDRYWIELQHLAERFQAHEA